MMSKDGDWIVREKEEDLAHIRAVLARHGAYYRYGAPLDARWLAGGWSAHLEYRREDGLRVRTDFFSRPPRLNDAELAALWREQEGADIPFVGLRDLALMKMTQREKDYPIIGELARRLPEVADQLRFSRSPHDLILLAAEYPVETARVREERPLLRFALASDRGSLGEALDAERRPLMDADAARLSRYQEAATRWAAAWPGVDSAIAALPLDVAHAIVCGAAAEHLSYAP